MPIAPQFGCEFYRTCGSPHKEQNARTYETYGARAPKRPYRSEYDPQINWSLGVDSSR